ncbi:MAG: aminotransferase class I/II-fold pyridoxal phosphate-dependent enzyme [Clostridiales bacterium]|nr:aminotransferase class I/II-fold pyridoxal phosphate-dependent enzyme [Clostridiales bacterium]
MINYDNVLSDKIKTLKPSGIRKFFDIAQTIDGVISLGVGEPDFPTPWAIRSVAITTLEKGKTVYTSNSGLIQLREEIAEYIKRNNSLNYDPNNEIIVTVGGSEAIDISLRAMINPGDEVLIVEPCFVCYAPIVTLCGGIPINIDTKVEDNFKLTPESLKDKISSKTKLLVLPFPSNPTGAIMTREELQGIADILMENNIFVLSDEIYSELTYGRNHCSIAEIDGMKERTIMVNGFSKAFAMTGWRLGYLAAPEPIVSQALKIHQYAIMCSPTVSQYAAIEALKNCDREVRNMVSEYDKRRRLLVKSLNNIGLECFNPEGAFYVFPSIKSTGLSSEAFCERLLYEEKVAVVPGNAFGESGEGFIRVSYAYSLKHLIEALKRIERFVKKIKKD